jgi:hypothetical protein
LTCASQADHGDGGGAGVGGTVNIEREAELSGPSIPRDHVETCLEPVQELVIHVDDEAEAFGDFGGFICRIFRREMPRVVR